MSSHLNEIRYLRDDISRKSARRPVAPIRWRGVDLISDALPFGRLWYGEPDATFDLPLIFKSQAE